MVADSNGESYRIFVGGPAAEFVGGQAPNSDTQYPVIYVLDGKLNFAAVHAQVQLLSAMRQMPPAYVVGIGYAGDESFFEKDVLRRQGDLTPSEGGELEAQVKTMNGADGVSFGGAAAFLSFLEDELRPALAQTYAISTTDATILGNSLGGLFPSWILFHQPHLFKRYVIVSPSWWWNDYEVWNWEAEYADSHDDLPATVFATFGGLETAERHRAIAERSLQVATGETRRALQQTLDRSDRLGWMRGAELIPDFRKKLVSRRYPHLKLTALPLPEETHESIPGGGFSRGLRSVFGSWSQTD
jgi:predicted alpha/beta superfamily hydrolase